MTDTKDSSLPHEDTEFQFDEFDAPSHEDNASASSQATNQWQSSGMTQKNPRKIIAFGAIVFIIVVFIVYHFAASWNNPLDDLSKKSRAVVPTQKVADVKPVASTEAPAATENTALESKVSSLEQAVNQQDQTVTQLQSTIGSLQDSVNAVNNSVNNISQQLDGIHAQLTKPKKTAPVNMGPPPIQYIVKAMVPGRAWLQGSDGSSLSVSVGSDIPKHGTVTQIDLTNGQVLTSDGTAITYDINGN